ncbi:MAG: ArsA family ATPase, partial [Actinomycetes bacterium]
ATYRMLQDDATAFLVVASPDPDALREASYFVDRLTTEGMPLAGLVLNRVQTSPVPSLTAERAMAAAEQLEEDDDHELTSGLLRLHAERMRRRTREQAVAGRFFAGHRSVPVAQVTARPGDVHDLDGLRSIGDDLASAKAA